MSLSQSAERIKNPARKFIEYSGGKGLFKYYDKEKGDDVVIPHPFTFTVLDQLSCITGWNDEHGHNVFSNEVRSTKDKIIVKVKDAGNNTIVLAEGSYEEIKGKAGKYTKSIYAYFNGEIVNIKLKGAGLTAWIDSKVNTNSFSVLVSGFTQEKKGATTYFKPVFESAEMKDAKEAKEADKELQAYLNQGKEEYDSGISKVTEPLPWELENKKEVVDIDF